MTGATGFLGVHLARALRDDGHDVVPFSRRDGGDIHDTTRIREASRGCDGAFHCAGKVSRSPRDAEEMYRLHVEGTKSLLDGCAASGVRRVVVASSSGTVAVSEVPGRVATEEDEAPIGLLGRWPYYRAKLFAERAALARNGDALQVVCVNPSLLLGPGDSRGSSTQDVRLFMEGRIPVVPAGGLSFVDARDAAEAMYLAMKRGRPGQRYLVGACNLTLADFFGRLARISNVPAPWLPMPRSRQVVTFGASVVQRLAARAGLAGLVMGIDPVAAEMAQCFWYLDANKASRELGWTARDPNETLFDTVQDLRARGVVWSET